jgi:GT2 family glycosyltransferase
MDLCRYRRYIAESYGEFTAAKEQNVRLRTGWFSDRSATYMASGRPVITQDTGFGSALPTGEGLFPCSTPEEALAAVERIDSDPARHRRAAFDIAREHFAHDVVLGALLDHLGMGRPPRRGIDDRPRRAFPFDLVLEPHSRRPTRLHPETVDTVMRTPLPPVGAAAAEPVASVIVVSYNTLVFTRMCLESVLANTDAPPFELVVVDNASVDGSRKYLRALAERDARVRVVENDHNVGFPAACNKGLALARGRYLVLLNSDAMVAPRWLDRLLAPLDAGTPALVGPVTNRIGNEAEVDTAYETWGGYLREARARAAEYAGATSEIPTLTMFCLAVRRETKDRLGDLDEDYGVGTLEDDDYSMRARREGVRLLLAEDVLVHHFGEASFGKLFADGEYSRVVAQNRARYEGKWREPWQQYSRRRDDSYDQLVARIRRRLSEVVPDGATVLVVSKGDDRLVELNGLRALHFPATAEGGWAGHHPADGSEAIGHLRALEADGAAYIAFPATSFWWFDFYPELTEHLRERELVRDDDCAVFRLGGSGA